MYHRCIWGGGCLSPSIPDIIFFFFFFFTRRNIREPVRNRCTLDYCCWNTRPTVKKTKQKQINTVHHYKRKRGAAHNRTRVTTASNVLLCEVPSDRCSILFPIVSIVNRVAIFFRFFPSNPVFGSRARDVRQCSVKPLFDRGYTKKTRKTKVKTTYSAQGQNEKPMRMVTFLGDFFAFERVMFTWFQYTPPCLGLPKKKNVGCRCSFLFLIVHPRFVPIFLGLSVVSCCWDYFPRFNTRSYDSGRCLSDFVLLWTK